MNIIKRNQFIDIVKSKTCIGQNDVETICDLFIQSLYENLGFGNSISFGNDYPLMKTKKKISHLNEGSPRTAKNDCIYAAIRIPLGTKAGK